MTEQHDPALHDAGYVEGYGDGYDAGHADALAAAEAAPLDVERLARALELVSEPDWPGRIGVSIPLDAYEETDDPASVRVARFIAREYAALRSPDTETAKANCGFTYPGHQVPCRHGYCIECHACKSPDTETAVES